MGQDKFREDMTEEQKKVHPKIQAFIKKLEAKLGVDNVVITSANRPGAKVKKGPRKGQPSRHGSGQAIDIRMGGEWDKIENERVYDYLLNTKEGLMLMKEYGLGFLDETSITAKEKYGATAPIIHIGFDSTAIDARDRQLNNMDLDPSDPKYIREMNPDFLVAQKQPNYRTAKKEDYENYMQELDDPNNPLGASEIQARKDDKNKKVLQNLGDSEILADQINAQYNSVLEEYDQIMAEDITEATKQEKLHTVYQKIKSLGKGDEFNQRLNDLNIESDKIRDEFRNGTSKEGLLYQIMTKSELGPEVNKKNGTLSFWVTEDDFKKIEPYLSKEEIELFGKPQGGGFGKSWSNHPGDKVRRKFQTKTYTQTVSILDQINKKAQSFTGQSVFVSQKLENGMYDLTPNLDAKIDPNSLTLQPYLHYEPDFNQIKTVQEETGFVQEQETTKPELVKPGTQKPDTDTTKADKTVKEIFGDFFDKEKTIVPDVMDYDPKNFNFADSVPLGALFQAGLAMKGLSDADVKIPLRDEKISQSIINHTKALQKMSQMGLRPEEEAYMKATVADAYKEGMDRVVRASGGNRNLVLGNQSSLNRNRIDGLMKIAIADVEAKDRALEKYGPALEYINDFNATRDIANHDIKLEEARRKRLGGENLANAAFGQMLEEIQYTKENMPGSPQHALKSALEFETFGYVPGMKDNGKGDTVGTRSYAKRLKQQASDANEAIDAEKNARNQIQADYYKLPAVLRAKMEKEGETRGWFMEQFDEYGIKDSWMPGQSISNPEKTSPKTQTKQNAYFNDPDTFNGNRVQMLDAREGNVATDENLASIVSPFQGKDITYESGKMAAYNRPTANNATYVDESGNVRRVDETVMESPDDADSFMNLGKVYNNGVVRPFAINRNDSIQGMRLNQNKYGTPDGGVDLEALRKRGVSEQEIGEMMLENKLWQNKYKYLKKE